MTNNHKQHNDSGSVALVTYSLRVERAKHASAKGGSRKILKISGQDTGSNYQSLGMMRLFYAYLSAFHGINRFVIDVNTAPRFLKRLKAQGFILSIRQKGLFTTVDLNHEKLAAVLRVSRAEARDKGVKTAKKRMNEEAKLRRRAGRLRRNIWNWIAENPVVFKRTRQKYVTNALGRFRKYIDETHVRFERKWLDYLIKKEAEVTRVSLPDQRILRMIFIPLQSFIPFFETHQYPDGDTRGFGFLEVNKRSIGSGFYSYSRTTGDMIIGFRIFQEFREKNNKEVFKAFLNALLRKFHPKRFVVPNQQIHNADTSPAATLFYLKSGFIPYGVSHKIQASVDMRFVQLMEGQRLSLKTIRSLHDRIERHITFTENPWLYEGVWVSPLIKPKNGRSEVHSQPLIDQNDAASTAWPLTASTVSPPRAEARIFHSGILDRGFQTELNGNQVYMKGLDRVASHLLLPKRSEARADRYGIDWDAVARGLSTQLRNIETFVVEATTRKEWAEVTREVEKLINTFKKGVQFAPTEVLKGPSYEQLFFRLNRVVKIVAEETAKMLVSRINSDVLIILAQLSLIVFLFALVSLPVAIGLSALLSIGSVLALTGILRDQNMRKVTASWLAQKQRDIDDLAANGRKEDAFRTERSEARTETSGQPQKFWVPHRVLIVEDDDVSARFYKAQIRAFWNLNEDQIDIVSSGDEAVLRFYPEYPATYDLLILDHDLPGEIHGKDVLALARLKSKQTMIVFNSANSVARQSVRDSGLADLVVPGKIGVEKDLSDPKSDISVWLRETNSIASSRRSEARSEFPLNQEEERILRELGMSVDEKTGKLFYIDRTGEPRVELEADVSIVRHGETLLIEQSRKDGLQRFQGALDGPENQLSEEGKRQAEESALKLYQELIEERKLDPRELILVSSPLTRVLDTLQAFIDLVKERTGYELKITRDEELERLAIEISFGAYENLTEPEIRAMGEKDYQLARAFRNGHALVRFPAGEKPGESFVQDLVRAYYLTKYINEHYRGKHVVLGSHGTTSGAMRVIQKDPAMFNADGFVDWRTNMLKPAQVFHLSKMSRRAPSQKGWSDKELLGLARRAWNLGYQPEEKSERPVPDVMGLIAKQLAVEDNQKTRRPEAPNEIARANSSEGIQRQIKAINDSLVKLRRMELDLLTRLRYPTEHTFPYWRNISEKELRAELEAVRAQIAKLDTTANALRDKLGRSEVRNINNSSGFRVSGSELNSQLGTRDSKLKTSAEGGRAEVRQVKRLVNFNRIVDYLKKQKISQQALHYLNEMRFDFQIHMTDESNVLKRFDFSALDEEDRLVLQEALNKWVEIFQQCKAYINGEAWVRYSRVLEFLLAEYGGLEKLRGKKVVELGPSDRDGLLRFLKDSGIDSIGYDVNPAVQNDLVKPADFFRVAEDYAPNTVEVVFSVDSLTVPYMIQASGYSRNEVYRTENMNRLMKDLNRMMTSTGTVIFEMEPVQDLDTSGFAIIEQPLMDLRGFWVFKIQRAEVRNLADQKGDRHMTPVEQLPVPFLANQGERVSSQPFARAEARAESQPFFVERKMPFVEMVQALPELSEELKAQFDYARAIYFGDKNRAADLWKSLAEHGYKLIGGKWYAMVFSVKITLAGASIEPLQPDSFFSHLQVVLGHELKHLDPALAMKLYEHLGYFFSNMKVDPRILPTVFDLDLSRAYYSEGTLPDGKVLTHVIFPNTINRSVSTSDYVSEFFFVDGVFYAYGAMHDFWSNAELEESFSVLEAENGNAIGRGVPHLARDVYEARLKTILKILPGRVVRVPSAQFSLKADGHSALIFYLKLGFRPRPLPEDIDLRSKVDDWMAKLDSDPKLRIPEREIERFLLRMGEKNLYYIPPEMLRRAEARLNSVNSTTALSQLLNKKDLLNEAIGLSWLPINMFSHSQWKAMAASGDALRHRSELRAGLPELNGEIPGEFTPKQVARKIRQFSKQAFEEKERGKKFNLVLTQTEEQLPEEVTVTARNLDARMRRVNRFLAGFPKGYRFKLYFVNAQIPVLIVSQAQEIPAGAIVKADVLMNKLKHANDALVNIMMTLNQSKNLVTKGNLTHLRRQLAIVRQIYDDQEGMLKKEFQKAYANADKTDFLLMFMLAGALKAVAHIVDQGSPKLPQPVNFTNLLQSLMPMTKAFDYPIQVTDDTSILNRSEVRLMQPMMENAAEMKTARPSATQPSSVEQLENARDYLNPALSSSRVTRFAKSGIEAPTTSSTATRRVSTEINRSSTPPRRSLTSSISVRSAPKPSATTRKSLLRSSTNTPTSRAVKSDVMAITPSLSAGDRNLADKPEVVNINQDHNNIEFKSTVEIPTLPRNDERLISDSSINQAADHVALAIAPESVSLNPGDEIQPADVQRELVILKEVDVDVFSEKLRAAVIKKLKELNPQVDVEIVDPEIVKQLTGNWIDLLAEKLSGKLSIAFEMSGQLTVDKIVEAFQAEGFRGRIKNLILTGERVNLTPDQRKTIGLPVMLRNQVDFRRLNPERVLSQSVLPVVSKNPEFQLGPNNPGFLEVGVDTNRVDSDPYLELTESVLQIVIGLLAAEKIKKVKDLTIEQIRAELLKDLFIGYGSREDIVRIDQGRLIISRLALRLFLEHEMTKRVEMSA